MNFSSMRFDWEADTSKTNLMSTSQDFPRFSLTDHSQFVPADWASVVEPFQQKRSIDFNGDVPIFADKWSSQGSNNTEQRNQRTSIAANIQNPLAESIKFFRKPSAPLSSQRSDNIFRAVIKLSLITNQRLKYGMYKMRIGGTSKVKPKALLTLPQDLNFKEGYRSSGFTFGTKSPFSLTPSEVYVKKENSILLRQAESLKNRLIAIVMRQVFGKLKSFRKPKTSMPSNTDSLDLVKVDSIMSLPRRPVATLNIQELTAQNVKFTGQENLIVPGKLERNSRLLPIVSIKPDEKNMQESGQETDHSTILPHPITEGNLPIKKTVVVERPSSPPITINVPKQTILESNRINRIFMQDSSTQRPTSENPYARAPPNHLNTEMFRTSEQFLMFPAVTERRRSPPARQQQFNSRQTFTLEEVLQRINRSKEKQLRTGNFSPQPSIPRKSMHEHNNFPMPHQFTTLQQTRSPLNIPITLAKAVSPKTAASPRVMSPGGGHRYMPPVQLNRLPPAFISGNQYGLLREIDPPNYKPFQKPVPYRLH